MPTREALDYSVGIGMDHADISGFLEVVDNAHGDLDFSSAALNVHERVILKDTIFADAFSFLRDTAIRRLADLG